MSLPLPTEVEKEISGPMVLPRFFSKSFLWVVAFTGLDLLFVLIMAAFLVTVLLVHGASLRFAQSSVLYPIGMMVGLLLTRWIHWVWRHYFKHGNGTLSMQKVFLQTLRDWIPFILIDFIYENLHDLSRFFHTHDIAGAVMAMDVKLFGVELTLWSQRFFHPLLTDYMAFAYALYFILPLILMYFLSYRNRRSELREIVLALSLTFLIGFLCYVFFPCSPPRYFLESQYTDPVRLYGVFLFNQLQGKWDGLSVIRAGAFPSLHVGISTIALIYAFRFRKWGGLDRFLYWLFLPLVVSLWISTIYLRHHWFIDIAAGWLLAIASAWIAARLTESWEDLRKKVGLPHSSL